VRCQAEFACVSTRRSAGIRSLCALSVWQIRKPGYEGIHPIAHPVAFLPIPHRPTLKRPLLGIFQALKRVAAHIKGDPTSCVARHCDWGQAFDRFAAENLTTNSKRLSRPPSSGTTQSIAVLRASTGAMHRESRLTITWQAVAQVRISRGLPLIRRLKPRRRESSVQKSLVRSAA
jgi:hypothetical protein